MEKGFYDLSDPSSPRFDEHAENTDTEQEEQEEDESTVFKDVHLGAHSPRNRAASPTRRLSLKYEEPRPTSTPPTLLPPAWLRFLARYAKVIIGLLLGTFLIVLAFTPLGQGLTAFFFLKSFCYLLLKLSKLAFGLKFLIGIGLLGCGVFITHLDCLLCISWLVGWLMKCTVWITKGCKDFIAFITTHLIQIAFHSSSPIKKIVAKLALGIAAVCLFLPVFLILVVSFGIALLGDKFIRRESTVYVHPLFERLQQFFKPGVHHPELSPQPTISPSTTISPAPRVSFQSSRRNQGFFDACYQEIDTMAQDCFTIAPNPDDLAHRADCKSR